MNGVTILVTALVVFHVVVIAVAAIVTERRKRTFRHRFHVPIRPIGAAWLAAFFGCVLLALVGDPPFDPSWSRGELRAAWGWGLLLVGGITVGFAAIVAGLYVCRRILRLRTGGIEPPGDVVVTGRALPADGTEPEPSPVFERPAVCWTWLLEAKDRFGVDSDWTHERAGSGGVPLRVESDAADVAVTVDPADARVTVPRSDSTVRSPDAPAPGRLDRVADTDIGGSEHRYSEGTVAPGGTVTVVGEADADGRIVDDAREPWLVGGDRSTVRRRLRRRVAASVAGGAVCLGISLRLYLSWLHLY
ncbi:hypothetical protein [Halopiger thermotolerans]